MMEEEVSDDEDDGSEKRAESPEEEAMDETADEPAVPEPEEPEPAETVTTSNGRRRGKRKVMRKKQIMDDQGYLGMFLALSRDSKGWAYANPCRSHNPRTRMGVFFRRRSSSGYEAEDFVRSKLCPPFPGRQVQERRSEGEPGKSGQYHVLFLKEVTGTPREAYFEGYFVPSSI